MDAGTPSAEVRRSARALDLHGLGVLWMLLAMGCLGLRLGGHPLIDPDEGRNAATALEMATSGNYVVPRLNGLPHLDKPVLFYAASALSMRLLGPSELAARLPALLATWGTVALVVWFSAYLFGRRTAWIAGTACATAPLSIAMARTVIFDSLLGFFVVLALIAFYRAIEAEAGPSWLSGPRGWALLAWVAVALGILTKGPVALVIPVLVAGPYAFWRRRSRVVWHPFGWVPALLLLLPWVLAVEAQVPGFLRYAMVTETWQRLTTRELDRSGPIWYFLPFLIGGCFPWVLVVAASVRERWRELQGNERRPVIYLALWIALPLLFFSFSQSKRPQYILPLVAAVALLTAWAWSGERLPGRGIRAGAIGWLLLGGVLLWVASAGAERLESARGLAASAQPTALALGALMVAAGVLAWMLSRHQRPSLIALSLPLALLPAASAPLMADVARERSARDLAAALRPHLTPETAIVGIETFPPSLSFYLGQPVELCSATGAPLRSNFVLHSYGELVGRSPSTLHPPGWWQEALASCTRPLVFLVKKRYQPERELLEQAGLPLLFEDPSLVAMGPCRPPAEPSRKVDGES